MNRNQRQHERKLFVKYELTFSLWGINRRPARWGQDLLLRRGRKWPIRFHLFPKLFFPAHFPHKPLTNTHTNTQVRTLLKALKSKKWTCRTGNRDVIGGAVLRVSRSKFRTIYPIRPKQWQNASASETRPQTVDVEGPPSGLIRFSTVAKI